MRKIIVKVLSVLLTLSMLLIVTSCGEPQELSSNTENISNIFDDVVNTVSESNHISNVQCNELGMIPNGNLLGDGIAIENTVLNTDDCSPVMDKSVSNQIMFGKYLEL